MKKIFAIIKPCYEYGTNNSYIRILISVHAAEEDAYIEANRLISEGISYNHLVQEIDVSDNAIKYQVIINGKPHSEYLDRLHAIAVEKEISIKRDEIASNCEKNIEKAMRNFRIWKKCQTVMFESIHAQIIEILSDLYENPRDFNVSNNAKSIKLLMKRYKRAKSPEPTIPAPLPCTIITVIAVPLFEVK